MEYEGEPDWKPIFDPKQFADENDELKIEDYKLKSSLLESYAIQVTELRSSIKAKADSMDVSLDDPSINEYLQRTRKGMKHSTKANNHYGESEKEIKQQLTDETYPGKRYDKRKLKDLDIDDRVEIIHSAMIHY